MPLSRAQLLAMIAIPSMTATSGRSQTPAAYTASQAADGLAAYQTNCANCHLPDLAGRNEAPQLAGGNFMNAWGARTTTDLIRFYQATMPPSNRGGLSEETFTEITAVFLQANGAFARHRILHAAYPVRIHTMSILM